MGAGILDGGAGIDTLDVSHSTTTNVVNLASGLVDWGSGGQESALNFENVIAGAGRSTITGTTGENRIEAGAGNDTMTGLSGADVFVFNLGDGVDIITDFENGIDLLDFTSTGINFTDLVISTNSDGSTLVAYDNGQQIELQNTTGLIDENDFVFS